MDGFGFIANQPIVIDNGSGIIKAGFAGEDTPKFRFCNYIGFPKHVRVMAGGLEGDVFIGPKAEEHRGLLSIKYPMEHGIVRDWRSMEQVWHYLYSKEQLHTNPEDHPVLLTEAPLNPTANRMQAVEFFFETLNVPALYISMQAVLSLYATGRTTGVVLDSGDGVTHSVPVYEGFSLTHSISRSDIAGRDITAYLQTLLRKEGHVFKTTSEFEVVKSIKESACFISQNPNKEEQIVASKGGDYVLPDGSIITIGKARFRSPELLFHPHLIGEETEGIHTVLGNAIRKSDLDIRKILYTNIVLSGGSTLFKGFGDRLLTEMRDHSPKDIKIRISAPSERMFSTWMGGSILASLEAFKRIWITKKEYSEEGQKVVERKTV